MSQLSEVAQPEGTLLAAQDADAVAGTVDVIRKLTCVKQRVQRNRLLFHEFSRDDARSLVQRNSTLRPPRMERNV